MGKGNMAVQSSASTAEGHEEKPQDAGAQATPIDVDEDVAMAEDDGEATAGRIKAEEEEGEKEEEDAPRRSTRVAASSAADAASSRRRRRVEPVRYSQLQDQDRAIAKLKHQQAVFRKGEKRPSDTSGGGGGSSKRSRAEERRSARRAKRREARSPPLDATVDSDVWRSVPTMALDGSGPQSKPFTTTADAVHATVLHSTVWRRLQLTSASDLPSNLLPIKTMEPFAAVLDKPLEAYDEQVAMQCQVLLQPVAVGSLTATNDDVKTHVRLLLDEAQPLVKSCHKKRVNHVLETTRRDVRACLALQAATRQRFTAMAKKLEPVKIPELHEVAAKRLLTNATLATPEDVEDAMPTYYVGKGENTVRERAFLPKEIVFLNALPAISRSTACIGVRTTLAVDDDPIIRYVPYFSQESKADTQFTQFPSFEAMQKAAVSALDDEQNEYVLRYVVRACDGDARAFHALKELAWCLQPQTDYATLQLRVANERLLQLQPQRRRNGLSGSVRERLSGGDATQNDTSEGPRLTSGAPASSPESLVKGFRSMFCRRCYVYNCQLHGIQQPTAQARTDPVYPVVKTSLHHLLGDEDNEEVDEEGVKEELTEATAVVSEVETTTKTVETRTEVEMEVDATSDEVEVTEMRRSVRSITAAATKASTLLHARPQRKRAPSFQSRSPRRGGSGVDKSEYLGYEAVYKNMTSTKMKALVESDTDGCSTTCYKKQSGDDAAPVTWSEGELAMLELSLRKLGSNACVLSHVMQSKTCAQVRVRLIVNAQNVLLDDVAAARANVQRLLEHRRSSSHGVEQLASIRANSQEHLLRTRFQRMKDRGANHQFTPCHHSGSHVSCNANDCSCMRRDHFCEKSCGCPRDCANRFPGCRCARGECGTMACPCFFSGRECDPDVCGTCGACEVPLLAVDSSSQSKSSKKLRVCANTNILRGMHRKVGVAQSKTHGWGAFALEDIGEGEFIYEYTGELLSQDEAERRGNVYDRNAVSFLFDLNEDAVVDAARKGNKSKFANHSSTDPNCAARIMMVNGDHRIGLYAKRRIADGEELFFDYGHHGVVPDWSQARIRSTAPKGMPPGAPSSVENSSVPSSPRRSVEIDDHTDEEALNDEADDGMVDIDGQDKETEVTPSPDQDVEMEEEDAGK